MPGQANAGNTDAFLRRYGGDGSVSWTRQFGTSAVDEGRAVAADGSGAYIAGETRGTLPGQTSAGGADAFVRMYDPIGNIVWTRQFGTGQTDRAHGVAADASGVYVGGYTTGTLPGQTNSGGISDAFVRKYDASGNLLWTRQFGTSGYDVAWAIASNVSSVVVAGETDSVFPGEAAAGFRDAFLRVYDAGGNVLWTRQFGTTGADVAWGVAADISRIYVAGEVAGSLPGQTSSGITDAFVRAYHGNGTANWTRQFGTSGYDTTWAAAANASGVYVAGEVAGALPGETSSGGTDAFVRAYHGNGTANWTRQFGSGGYDAAFGVGADPTWVFPGGQTGGVLPGEASAGGYDAFLVKIGTAAIPPPPGPTGVQAELVGGGQDVLVTWNLSSPETNVDHYEVWRGEGYSAPGQGYAVLPSGESLPPGTSSFIDDTTNPGQTEFYIVFSVNAGGRTAGDFQAAKLVRQLQAGMSLVGLPLDLPDRRVGTVFQSVSYDIVRTYNPLDAADPWDSYTPSGRVRELATLDMSSGAWVNLTTGGEWRIAGRVPGAESVGLVAGWNLVCYPSIVNRTVSLALGGIGIGRVELFDPATPPYYLRAATPSDNLSAGSALWLLSLSNQSWTLSN